MSIYYDAKKQEVGCGNELQGVFPLWVEASFFTLSECQ